MSGRCDSCGATSCDVACVTCGTAEVAGAVADLRAKLAAAEAEATQLRGALHRCVDVLSLCITRDFDAPEDDEVYALGERIGFGAVMSAASRGWARYLNINEWVPGAQHTTGPCAITVAEALATARAALAVKP